MSESDMASSGKEPLGGPAEVDEPEAAPQPALPVGRAPKRARQVAPKSQPQLREFSITVSRLGENVTEEDVVKFLAYCREKEEAGGSFLFGVEQGDTAFRKHIQAVMRALATSAVAVNREIKRRMGWEGAAHKGHVCVKELKNNKLHTFTGMLGYCTKSMNEEGFVLQKSGDITQGDILQGQVRAAWLTCLGATL